MHKKNILIASVSFFPRISPRSYRATELAKEFSKQGHNVTVLIHKYQNDCNYEIFEKTNNIRIKDFVNNKLSVEKKYPGSLIGLLQKIWHKLFDYFCLWPDIKLTFLLDRALQRENGYDLLISIAVPYPVHWGVALARGKNMKLTKTWVADCGDPFTGNKERKLPLPFYFKYVENWFCRKPDFITVPVPEAINAYPLFCRDRIRVIPQGFNFDEFKIDPKPVRNAHPIFAYAGSLSRGVRDPSQFLDFLCKKKDKDFKFILYTRNIGLINPYIEILGKKIEIKEYIPRNQLLVELNEVDFLVNFENRETVQLPSKLIDYALIKKPILSIKPNALNEAVCLEFLDGFYKNSMPIGDIQQYNINNVAKKFIELSNR